jgi:hypothetical protein
LRSSSILATNTASEQIITIPTQADKVVAVPTAIPDNSGRGNADTPVYDSGGIYFEYPQGWRADTINDGGGTVIIVGNSQAAIDNWRSESFSLENGVADGQIAIAIIPNIEDSLALGDGYDVWDVVDTLQQALQNSDYYAFSDISEYYVDSGEAAYTLGSGNSYSVEIKVIDTDGEAGFVLLFGAAGFDRVVDLTEAIITIAESLEV